LTDWSASNGTASVRSLLQFM